MARLNTSASGPAVLTHEGAPAVRVGPLKELRRSVLTALLWENTFYEKGADVAKRVADLVPQCKAEDVAALAIEARDRMYLRHVPLFLVRQLAKVKGNGPLVAATLEHVIQRPDEMGEYLAMYWEGQIAQTPRPAPLSAGSKRGLARAFRKFSAYQLAKYDRDAGVKLRDVLRLVHAKAADTEQATLWKHVIARDLESPDTWEVELSAGKNKREVFERLLRERKLGALAFLRNLRNMIEAGVDTGLIRERFAGKLDKVLPFRFIAAVRHAPAFAQELNDAMLRAVADEPKLSGRTIVLVDVSGSMNDALSQKSEMKRMDVAAGLAVLVRELGECRVFTFSDSLVEAPAYRGLALVKGILDSQPHSGTATQAAIAKLRQVATFDRLIVITDEQSHDRVEAPGCQGYVINVATYKTGVGYGQWVHIDGWSERVLDFIREVEQESAR
jgi:60 kDa SS-A/Ro ribonucleoprotein